MFLWPTALAHWPKPEARQTSTPKSSATTAMLGMTIINAWLVTTTATVPAMTTILAIALGSIATMPSTASAQQSTNSLRNQGQSNYQGVDAVSAITGLSNGYATPSYMHTYYQLRSTDSAAESQRYNYHHQPPQSQHPELHDKEPVSTGRSLLRATGHYGNRSVGSAGASTDALEVFNVPGSGFMPTTVTAAGQHYAASLVELTDKTNAIGTPPAASKIDLQQSSAAPTTAETTATSYYNMASTFNDNGGGESAPSLYGRLTNYDDLVGGAAGRSGSNTPGDIQGLHNFALAYDNYAANLYNDAQTNGREHQEHFANYFTPTTSAILTTTGRSSYGATGNQHHKYLPLNNYQQLQQEHHQQQQQQHPNGKSHVYSRASSVPILTHSSFSSSAGAQSSSSLAPTYYDTFNQASNNIDNKLIKSTNYQTWSYVDKPPQDDYYGPKQSPVQHKLKEENNDDIKEPETAETSLVVHLSGKKGKNKSKRSNPVHESYDSYAVSHADNGIESTAHDHHNFHGSPSHDPHSHDFHSTIDNSETVEYQRQQLEELQKQLQKQQHQFVTLQHQLIDHDQQLQTHKYQPHYQIATPQSILPPVSTTIHHTPHSLQAIAGTPLSQHTHVVRTVPVPQRQQVYIPQRENVNIEVPDPVITTVNKPVPIQIPVSKTVTIPDIQEVKIPIEKLHPFPVERRIPYIVEKRVPYTVEKQIAKPIYYPVPIKVPIVHTVVHKLHTVHPHSYSYQNQNHISSHPIRYKGHVRHITHHHGIGHSHF